MILVLAFLGCVGGDGTVRTRIYIFRLVAVPGSGDGRHGCECAFVNVWEAEGRVEKKGVSMGNIFVGRVIAVIANYRSC